LQKECMVHQKKTENRDEKEDRDSEKPRLVPADLEFAEGDEEKYDETDLPPAMPPRFKLSGWDLD
jgi:hypothetical protein